MSYWSVLCYGHDTNCRAERNICYCEDRLYIVTGLLGFASGLVQCVIGYRASMAVLSDALHALSDAGADFAGAFIVWKVRQRHFRRAEDEERLRHDGNRIIAFLLVVGAILIAYEAIGRLSAPGYIVQLTAVLAAGCFALLVSLLRLRMLVKARSHLSSTNLAAVTLHAKSDVRHSLIICSTGLVAWGIGFLHVGPAAGYAATLRYIDVGLSFVLAAWMAFCLAPDIWTGAHASKHDHEH